MTQKRYDDPEWRAAMRVRLETEGVWASPTVSAGLDRQGVETAWPHWQTGWARWRGRRPAGPLAWAELPQQTDLARELIDFGRWAARRFDTLVVLAAGPAGAGITALTTALLHPYWNVLPPLARGGPRLFVLDTLDPERVSGLMDVIDPAQTLFYVVSEGGSATAPMAQFLLMRRALVNRLGEAYRQHVVVTTHPTEGALRTLARQEGYLSWPYPPDVGEAMALLSAVGLVPAAVCGLPLLELLAGAAYADAYLSADEGWSNPALLGAALLAQAHDQGLAPPGVWSVVGGLTGLADWGSHLAQGRLGQRLATLDPLVDGTVIRPTLLTRLVVDEYTREAPLPELRTRGELPDAQARAARDQVVAALGHLSGVLMSDLNQTTANDLTARLARVGRPYLTYRLPQLNPFTLGQLIYVWQTQAALLDEV